MSAREQFTDTQRLQFVLDSLRPTDAFVRRERQFIFPVWTARTWPGRPAIDRAIRAKQKAKR